MIGLIFKLIGMFLAVVFAALVVLNYTHLAEPGTLSIHTPSVEPCKREIAARGMTQQIEYVEVRWVWHQHAYGWGCFYELDDASTGTIAPMPR